VCVCVCVCVWGLSSLSSASQMLRLRRIWMSVFGVNLVHNWGFLRR
jgi:hypothetical protein